MIWITTVLMLGIAILFIQQGLYEKRLYLEQNPDKEKAADEGLFMDAVKRVAPAKSDDAPPLEEDDSLFASMARRVKNSENPVSRMMDKKSQESADSGDGFFDRTATSVRQKLESADEKLAARRARNNDSGGKNDLLSRIGEKVATAEEKLDARVARKSEQLGDEQHGKLVRSDSKMGKLVGMVGKKLDGMEGRIERKLERVREDSASDSPKEDLVSRYAAKIGPRMDAIDDKMVERTKQVSERLSRSSSNG